MKLLWALSLALCLTPRAFCAPVAAEHPQSPPPPRVVLYYVSFTDETFGPVTPENIKQPGNRIAVSREVDIRLLFTFLHGPGRPGQFNPRSVRLRVEQPDGHALLVDQEGVVQNGAEQYQVTPLALVQLDDLLDALAREAPRPRVTPPASPPDPPLLLAASQNKLSRVRALIRARADVNVSLPDGITALSVAVSEKNVAIVRLLLRHGARANAKGWLGEPILQSAVGKQNIQIVEALLGHEAAVNAKDTEGRTALMWAAIIGNDAEVKLLLQHRASVNATTDTGGTALMLAALNNHVSTVRMLISKGADVNARDEDRTTALGFAQKEKLHTIVDALKRSGATE